jgi:hypothetical protein
MKFEPTSFLATLQGVNHEAITSCDDKKWHCKKYKHIFWTKKTWFFISLFNRVDFGRFIITLNFVISFILKNMHNYFRYSFNKFKCIVWNFELSYIFKYYFRTSDSFTYIIKWNFVVFMPFQNVQQLRWFKIFISEIHIQCFKSLIGF